jgi:hypothetical protein
MTGETSDVRVPNEFVRQFCATVNEAASEGAACALHTIPVY